MKQPSEVLVDKQLERMIRVNAKRDRVRVILCGVCFALPGQVCVHPNGQGRVHNHKYRVDEAKSLGII